MTFTSTFTGTFTGTFTRGSGVRKTPRALIVEIDAVRALDAVITVGTAGQHDDLSVSAHGVEHLAHLGQPVRVGESQRVVDHHGNGVLLGDQGGAGQPRQDAELLFGPTG